MYKIIYTRKLMEYLRVLGFEVVKIIPDLHRPEFDNWVFNDSPELEEAIISYMDK